jgi:hypothetical protein
MAGEFGMRALPVTRDSLSSDEIPNHVKIFKLLKTGNCNDRKRESQPGMAETPLGG